MDTTQTNSFTISSSARGTRNSSAAGRALPFVLCVLTALAVLFLADRLLMPKYMSGIYEGALIAEYYVSEKDHQLIVIGDCEAYENISTVTLWEEYGITSFIRGSPQQLVWKSYYLLEDALRFETPEAVIFSVFCMVYGEPQSEAYNRLTLDGMRFSAPKAAAVRASMTEGESFLSYFFPLLRFHGRWKELSFDDIRYMFHKRGVSHNGFTMRADVRPAGRLPTPPGLADYAISRVCWDYLDKMRELCAQNGIEFILFKAPVLYPHWYPEWDAQIAEYSEAHNLLYINALDNLEEIGIDFSTDTYNGGLHLNVWGAQKMSKYLGGILSERGLGGLRSDGRVSAVWADKAREYHAHKAIQLREIEETGNVITLTRER
jgi:hypothetical protein